MTDDLGLVYAQAQRIAHHCGRLGFEWVDARDYLSDGWLGLHAARATFNPSRGCQFSTHAVPRIRGAILDGIRSEAQVNRTTGHTPCFADLSDALTDPRPLPSDDAEQADARARVRAAIVALGALTPAERYVIVRRYWYEEMSVTVARRVRRTEARISQRLASAHAKLRRSLLSSCGDS